MTFKQFWKEINWITVNGAHIPIKDGQSKKEAVKEHASTSFPKSSKENEMNEYGQTLPKGWKDMSDKELAERGLHRSPINGKPYDQESLKRHLRESKKS